MQTGIVEVAVVEPERAQRCSSNGIHTTWLYDHEQYPYELYSIAEVNDMANMKTELARSLPSRDAEPLKKIKKDPSTLD